MITPMATRAFQVSSGEGTGKRSKLPNPSAPLGVTPERAPVDAYLVAAKSHEGGVLAFHSALELHGLTEMIVFHFSSRAFWICLRVISLLDT